MVTHFIEPGVGHAVGPQMKQQAADWFAAYDPAARVLRADGTPSPAWFNPGTKVQSFGLKCNRALDFARQNAPEIHQRYGTTAAYLDVHSCVPPWHQLDHEASQPMAAMATASITTVEAMVTRRAPRARMIAI